MNSQRTVTHWDSDFCDMRSAIPIPEPRNLRDYALSNGLQVRCLEPNRLWQIHYDDGEGTSIDVRYEALMPAFDIHDPEMDPMCASSPEGKFAWGTAYNGHFDQTGVFTGSVTLRGRRVPIDCVSTMDHSWGPRPERGAPAMSWLHAHFSQDFAIHAIFGFDPARENGRDLWLAHGYVLDRGKVFGLKAGTGQAVRNQERYPETVALRLTDSDDRVWNLNGRALTTMPWIYVPNSIGFNTLSEWTCAEQRGYGEIMDFIELPVLNALNSAPGTSRASVR
tara:strand:- start:761 stop:1597 length:837 start_codon:yes stop_codon:yes gene_type:complete